MKTTNLSTIYRQIKGETDAQESRAVAEWRASSEENESTYRAMNRVWQGTENGPAPPAFDLDAGWQRLAAQLPEPGNRADLAHRPVQELTPQPRRGWIARRYPRLIALAAALLVAVMLGLWLSRGGPHNAWREYATVGGQHYRVSLPDGSVVRLNAGSKLRFREGARDENRAVYLDGQAYFEVTHGERPFLVHTETARVVVLGTRFDVWARNHKTRVVVRDGKVALASADGAGELVLGARQAAIHDQFHPPRMLETLDTEAALSWMNGHIVYQRQPLGDVVIDLERLFGVRISLANPELEFRTVSASFSNERLANIIEELCLTFNLQFNYADGNYQIML